MVDATKAAIKLAPEQIDAFTIDDWEAGAQLAPEPRGKSRVEQLRELAARPFDRGEDDIAGDDPRGAA